MQILIALFALLFSSASYASSNDSISIIDAPLASNDPVQKTDDDRISACESNVQTLTGRVEVLEHAIRELQGKAATEPAPQTVMPEGQQSTPVATTSGSDEKREYDMALAALKEAKFEDSEKLFASFMQKYTNSELMGNAYFWYAETFYRRGEFDKAAVHYLKGYKQYPKSPKAADNLLKLALSLGELKKSKDACAMLNKLDAEYKNRPASSVKRAKDAKAKYCKH